MVEIIPAILEDSLSAIQERLESIQGSASSVQIDIADGHLVPSKTWPYALRNGQEEFARIVSGEEGMPLWEDFEFEFDLMVGKPSHEAPRFIGAGASRIVLHAGSDALETARMLEEARNAALPLSLGVALASSASAESFEEYRDLVDFVQVMGIAHAGFQGEPFDERALVLVRTLHERYPKVPIQVDGGVNLDTARRLAEAGASRLIAGSAIFYTHNPKKALRELEEEANG